MENVTQSLTLESIFMSALLAARESGARVPLDWFGAQLARTVIAADREGRLDRARTPHPSSPDFFLAVAQLARSFDPQREAITLPRSRPGLWRWAA
jgi:hypothetical protein